MPSISRLRRKRDELQRQYDLLSEKIERLRPDYVIETDAVIRFKLEKQIEQGESEREETEQKLKEVEEELEQQRKMKCFLSYSFRKEDEDIVSWFQEFLGAFPDLEVIEARNRPLPPSKQVEKCIEGADLVCAIITTREEGIPSPILEEVETACAKDKIIAAFVEEGISQQALGILPRITEFKLFQRDALGIKAPEYLKYIYNARVEVLKKKGRDRSTMEDEIDELSFAIGILEAYRDRIDDL